jgi:hypothetical protein
MSTFEGFEAPNTTPVPDIVFDELLEKLTGNELKVLLYIIRRTYGFGKNADAISLSQFREGITTRDGKVLDKGCGIKHNRTILVALRSLEEQGYIVSIKRTSKERDADTTIYKLHFKKADKASPQAKPKKRVVTSSNEGSLPQVTRGRYSRSPRVVTSSNTQERVVQETGKQETDLQERENTPTRASLFVTDEQRRIDGYFLKCCTRTPSVNDDLKRYWDILAPRIASQEDMNSLYEYTQRKCASRTDPRVWAGNLAEWVEAWEQEQKAPTWTQAPPDTAADSTPESETDEPMYAGKPLSHWTEETMEAANLPRLRRRVIRDKQAEWQQEHILTNAS